MKMKFSPQMIEKILLGQKTQTRRPERPSHVYTENGVMTESGRWVYRCDAFYEVQRTSDKSTVARIQIVEPTPYLEQLGWTTDADARAEGFENREAFFSCWRSLYGKANEKQWVWVVTFRLVQSEENANEKDGKSRNNRI